MCSVCMYSFSIQLPTTNQIRERPSCTLAGRIQQVPVNMGKWIIISGLNRVTGLAQATWGSFGSGPLCDLQAFVY